MIAQLNMRLFLLKVNVADSSRVVENQAPVQGSTYLLASRQEKAASLH
jgi:hypothetical protein